LAAGDPKPVLLQLLAVTLRAASPNNTHWFNAGSGEGSSSSGGGGDGDGEAANPTTTATTDGAALAQRAAARALTSGDAAHLASVARELGRALGYSAARAARAEARRVALAQANHVVVGWW
jgi:hypothetical protein